MKNYRIDRAKVFWRRVDDQTVVLNMDTGYYYVLDEVAGLVWNLIAGAKDHGAIVSEVTRLYHVNDSTASKDIEFHLDRLQKEGLIAMGSKSKGVCRETKA